MMETAQLYQSLAFLAYSAGAIIILAGIMLIKLLYDISGLTRNINETATIIKTELEPALKNINQSVEIVSGVIIKTDEGIKKVRAFVSKTPLKLLAQLSVITGKAAGGFFSGLCTAFKIFSKK